MNQPAVSILERRDFDALLEVLTRRGYTLIGPRVRDNAIVYDRIQQSEDLPVGWTDEQEGGTYRLRRREDQALFAYAVGPHSWKRWLFPPTLRLWQATRSEEENTFVVTETPVPEEPYAFIGPHAASTFDLALTKVLITL